MFCRNFDPEYAICNAGQRDRGCDECYSVLWTIHRSNPKCDTDRIDKSGERYLFSDFYPAVTAV